MTLLTLDLTQANVPPALWTEAAALPPGAPVIVMLHGARYSPASPAQDPFAHIFALNPSPDAARIASWPRALGFSGGDPAQGLGLAVGWEGRGSFRAAYRRAAGVGAELAPVLNALAAAAGRPVHLIGHSLGARVALSALRHAAPGAVGRAILLAAAELRPAAEAAAAAPAGLLAEIVNVTSRENDLYDLGLELLLAGGRALGAGMPWRRANWLDLPIDAAPTLDALARLGFAIAPPTARSCHWSPYLRDGVFALYRALLRDLLPLAALRPALPDRAPPRFSRLLARQPAMSAR